MLYIPLEGAVVSPYVSWENCWQLRNVSLVPGNYSGWFSKKAADTSDTGVTFWHLSLCCQISSVIETKCPLLSLHKCYISLPVTDTDYLWTDASVLEKLTQVVYKNLLASVSFPWWVLHTSLLLVGWVPHILYVDKLPLSLWTHFIMTVLFQVDQNSFCHTVAITTVDLEL